MFYVLRVPVDNASSSLCVVCSISSSFSLLPLHQRLHSLIRDGAIVAPTHVRICRTQTIRLVEIHNLHFIRMVLIKMYYIRIHNRKHKRVEREREREKTREREKKCVVHQCEFFQNLFQRRRRHLVIEENVEEAPNFRTRQGRCNSRFYINIVRRRSSWSVHRIRK